MAIDKYTKTVLTIIAACLIILTLKEIVLIPDAQAQSGVTKVTLCTDDGRRCGVTYTQRIGGL